ncbi:hypothetical protein B0T20DRAFT_128875 [Sordaria brevicollis]|uniref:Uncharacterized protein n=1 Tax=Sordaria brevicollis TaxID=83679 RepID=A0AAE0UFD5_SORBR|nr:hypothetical protein B0T20DRAFT_128875 [Sordaria brevicollis]
MGLLSCLACCLDYDVQEESKKTKVPPSAPRRIPQTQQDKRNLLIQQVQYQRRQPPLPQQYPTEVQRRGEFGHASPGPSRSKRTPSPPPKPSIRYSHQKKDDKHHPPSDHRITRWPGLFSDDQEPEETPKDFRPQRRNDDTMPQNHCPDEKREDPQRLTSPPWDDAIPHGLHINDKKQDTFQQQRQQTSSPWDDYVPQDGPYADELPRPEDFDLDPPLTPPPLYDRYRYQPKPEEEEKALTFQHPTATAAQTTSSTSAFEKQRQNVQSTYDISYYLRNTDSVANVNNSTSWEEPPPTPPSPPESVVAHYEDPKAVDDWARGIDQSSRWEEEQKRKYEWNEKLDEEDTFPKQGDTERESYYGGRGRGTGHEVVSGDYQGREEYTSRIVSGVSLLSYYDTEGDGPATLQEQQQWQQRPVSDVSVSSVSSYYSEPRRESRPMVKKWGNAKYEDVRRVEDNRL